MKVCSKCLEEKEDSFFYVHSGRCKVCQRQENREYYARNHSSIRARQAEWYSLNCEDVKKQYTEYRNLHRDEIRNNQKQWRDRNKDRVRAYRIAYRITHYIDPSHRLRMLVSNAIRYAIAERKGRKNSSILKVLPYTIQQLKAHLESQFDEYMHWENHGMYNSTRYTWQIDHIIPQSALPYDSMEHSNFQKCWALSNLRPLRSIDNIRKGSNLMSVNNKSFGNSFLFPIDPEDEPTAEIVVQLDLFSDDDKQELEDGFELVPEPLNNEGRKRCFWCCEKTSKKLLLNSYIDFCEGCQK